MLHGEIASGGMATLYFGRILGEAGFSRTVAVKCLHPQFAKDPDFLSMFVDEARLAARVRHPNVVPTLDVVALDGELFVVMEYIQGEALSRLLRAARRSSECPSLGVVANIMANVLEGLHAAHEARSERGEPLGIVHRDVSPQNVLVGVDGVTRVVDFGVAKASGRLQTTRDGQLKGKMPYMAPEQLRGMPVDRRTDIYAASVVLWEALAGKRLFAAEDEAAVFGMVLNAPVEPPSRFAPEVPAEVDAIVLRGLRREPDERFPTAAEMALALEQAVRIAHPREVGRWVERTAATALKERADRIADIESVSSVNLGNAARAQVNSSSALSVPASAFAHSGAPTPSSSDPGREVPAAAQSADGMAHSARSVDGRSGSHFTNLSMARPNGAPAPRPRVRRIAVPVGIAAVVGVVAAAAIGIRAARRAALERPSVEPADPAPETPALVSAEPALPQVVGATAAPSATATASATPEPTAVTVSSKVASAPTARPADGAGAAKAAPAPAKKPRQAADCNPPYTLDERGTRIPKPQCL